MDGYEYERKCAEMLKSKGFNNITVTPGSGDQGIDILAYKGNVKYGIQCKYYEGTVGNKAVQEAFSGASFYDCAVAMVITNSTLTKPAHALAQKLGVEVWENIDAVYLYESTNEGKIKQDKQRETQEDRAKEIENQRMSLQENADKIKQDLHQQLDRTFSQKKHELERSISSTKHELAIAIKDAKTEIKKQIDDSNCELRETQQMLHSMSTFKLLRKRALKQQEQQLQSQISQLRDKICSPQNETINQLQKSLETQQQQLEHLDREYVQQKEYVDGAIRVYRTRIESYFIYNFPDEYAAIKFKKTFGLQVWANRLLTEELILKVLEQYEGCTVKEIQSKELFFYDDYASKHFIGVLKMLNQEGRIRYEAIKGKTIFYKVKADPIIDNAKWDINKLPPVPALENIKGYCKSYRF